MDGVNTWGKLEMPVKGREGTDTLWRRAKLSQSLCAHNYRHTVLLTVQWYCRVPLFGYITIVLKLGWGDASVDKVLVIQAQGLSIYIKSQEWGMHVCNLNTGEAEIRGLLERAGQPAGSNQ